MPEDFQTGVSSTVGRFRWRGTEISRLEAFSDATLAFAVTLLVVSLEVSPTPTPTWSPRCADFPPSRSVSRFSS